MNYRFITRDSTIAGNPSAWVANIYRTQQWEDLTKGPKLALVYSDKPLDMPPKMQNRRVGDGAGEMPTSLMRGAASVTVDIPDNDGECYIAVFHQGSSGFQFIPSMPYHNVSADLSEEEMVNSIVYHVPYTAGTIMDEFVVLSAGDLAADAPGDNNVMWIHEADGVEQTRNGPLSFFSKMIGDNTMYFCTARLRYPSVWTMVVNNNWIQPHATGYVKAPISGGGGTVDLTEVLNKLDALAQQVTAVDTNVVSSGQTVGAKVDLVSTKIDSSTAAVTASVGTVGSKVDGVAAQATALDTKLTAQGTTFGQKIDTANSAITSLDGKVGSEGSMTRAIVASESISIKGKIDAIDLSSAGVPQNVIDMIMDLHAEALGSWSWDKRTGLLTMFDTHGLEVATFSVTDTPDVASRERRTDLEVS